MGFGKTSIALFDLGEKMPPRKGNGNDKLGKYIALIYYDKTLVVPICLKDRFISLICSEYKRWNIN